MRFIIGKYIDKITTYDIIKFGSNNGIYLDNSEADVLMIYLKNNWEDLLYGNPEPIIDDIRCKIGSKSDKIIELFYFYRKKYKDYL